MPHIIAIEHIGGRLMVEIEKPTGAAGSCTIYSEEEELAIRRRLDAAEALAEDYALLCGKLTAIIAWVVDNDGETLADNPAQLDAAKKALAEARAKYNA